MPRIENKLVINNRIQALRQGKGVTQQDLANAINVTRATVIALEKGSYNPSLELAFRLATYFNLTLEEVFYEEESGNE